MSIANHYANKLQEVKAEYEETLASSNDPTKYNHLCNHLRERVVWWTNKVEGLKKIDEELAQMEIIPTQINGNTVYAKKILLK